MLPLSAIKHVVFDMDGTIYSGQTLFPYTKQAFELLDACGVSFTYLTNNSSLSAKDYARKIKKLGLPGKSENIFTSSLATLFYLRTHYPKVRKIFLLGTDSLKEEFREAGYEIAEIDGMSPPDMVVVGFDLFLSYDRLCKTAWWVKQGIPYIATHPDKVCPTDMPTVLVDCGAVCDCLESATGRKPDKVLGKPDPIMIEGIMEKHHLQKHEVIMVGDRLYTDVAMGLNTGIIAALVLSGEATLGDLEKSGLKPQIVVDNILQLAEKIHADKSEEK